MGDAIGAGGGAVERCGSLGRAGEGAAGEDIGLMYVDGGPDLRTPEDNPTGILDSMGMAHMLGLPGTAPELAGIGRRRPLLARDGVCFFGIGSPPADATDEDRLLASLGAPTLHAPQVREDPAATARDALAALTADTDRFLVHFDVDVIDFFDLPAADVPLYGNGLPLTAAMRALAVMTGYPGFAGLILTEFNPDHGGPDGTTARTLVTALTSALTV